MMTARDEARAALSAYDRAGVETVLTKVPAVVAALRAMLDETEPTEAQVPMYEARKRLPRQHEGAS